MKEEIFRAIRGRKLIEFDYQGHYRVAEPHVFGRQDGVEQMLALQVRGSSASGLLPNWHTFQLAEMQRISVLAEGFRREPPGSWAKLKDWDEIYMAVE